MSTASSITLPFTDTEDIAAVAQFSAELVRQSVIFTAELDIGPSIGRTTSSRVIVLTFTGAY